MSKSILNILLASILALSVVKASEDVVCKLSRCPLFRCNNSSKLKFYLYSLCSRGRSQCPIWKPVRRRYCFDARTTESAFKFGAKWLNQPSYTLAEQDRTISIEFVTFRIGKKCYFERAEDNWINFLHSVCATNKSKRLRTNYGKFEIIFQDTLIE